MDHATIAYGLTWVGTGAWVVCFWWMHRISARQDALIEELQELARTQHDILREVHPDVGEIKEHVVEEQGAKINEISEQVTQVADTGSPRQDILGHRHFPRNLSHHGDTLLRLHSRGAPRGSGEWRVNDEL